MIMQGRVNSSGTAPMATTQFQLNTSPTAAATKPPTSTLRGSSQRRAEGAESDDEVDASELQLFIIDTLGNCLNKGSIRRVNVAIQRFDDERFVLFAGHAR